MARLTSQFWVAAFIARHMAEARFAAQIKKGAEGAGAIYITIDHLDGTNCLFGPAPQLLIESAADDDNDGERIFEQLLCDADALTCQDRLQKEQRFDPDIWIVALEDAGRDDAACHGLALIIEDSE